MINELLLSLDASSSQIGYTIWDVSKSEMITIDHCTLPKSLSLLEKANWVKHKFIHDLVQKYPAIRTVVIERAFVAMFGTTTNANTVATLNQFNFAIQYICYQEGWEVHTISPSDARKFAYPGQSFGRVKQTIKQKIFALVRQEIGDSYFPQKTITRGKNAGDVRYEDWCLDMSDAYVVGKAFFALKASNLTPSDLEELKSKKKKGKRSSRAKS